MVVPESVDWCSARLHKMSSGWPRWLLHRMIQLLLLCIFSTMLMSMLLNRAQQDQQEQTLTFRDHKRLAYIEEVRQEKLKHLQATIFKSLKRPPDETYNINITHSESISLERDIKDVRPDACKSIVYDTSSLPTISVVIPFYNEALSLLLRTVHSILNRTPPHLLHEILLINDHSLNEDLFEPLEKYLKLLPEKVKMVRTKRREGLIRARLIGASMATGDVLVFQDAHTENNAGWAEPLLQAIKDDPQIIIQPTVDQVQAQTMEYIAATNSVPRGGFSWDLRYVWMQMPEHESARIQSEAEAFRTPTLVGCALAADRKFFLRIGGFDDAFNIWGGENIEIAWRYWMCGSGAYTHPCSRVAHTFKPFAFRFDGDREKTVTKNLMRTAEIWMDDWKKYFYAAAYNWPSKRTHFTEADWETMDKRIALKEEMKCKNFTWYMENVFSEVPRPVDEAVYYGEVANDKSEACWSMHDDGYVGMNYFCFFHRVLPENLFYIDKQGRLHFKDSRCLRVDRTTYLIRTGECERVAAGELALERWDLDHYGPIRGLLRVRVPRITDGVVDGDDAKTYCVLQVTNVNAVHHREQMPQLVKCDHTKEFMYWRWTYKFDWSYDFSEPF